MILQWQIGFRTRITIESLIFLSFTLFTLSFRAVCAIPSFPSTNTAPNNDLTPVPTPSVEEENKKDSDDNFLVLGTTPETRLTTFVFHTSTRTAAIRSSVSKRSWDRNFTLTKSAEITESTTSKAEFEPGCKNDCGSGDNETLDDVGDANKTHINETKFIRGFLQREDSIWLWILKATVMVLIIVVSILGNTLVIVSVALHRRLHCAANYLLVSLATADLLVALCAMTFNASVELSGGRWLFGGIMCDLWNSFDVYFSTVSILHLCSISVDRYYAIVRPLEYPLTMTRQMLATMLAQAWIAPMLISFLPIFLGWYTTSEHLQQRALHPHICIFQVNAVYAVLSSSVSFWVPCTVMVIMYFRIFQEARKQEHAMITRASSGGGSSRSNGTQQEVARQQLMVALQGSAFTAVPEQQAILMKTLSDVSSNTSVTTRTDSIVGGGSSRNSSGATTGNLNFFRRQSRKGSIASWAGAQAAAQALNRRPTPLPPLIPPPAPPGRREHKAARTLGLIMGAFVLCWLPFFTWYVSINICGEKCHSPPAVVTAVFWIGYFNSTLNPFIYVYFRADFRTAFQSTLSRLHCCRSEDSSGVFV